MLTAAFQFMVKEELFRTVVGPWVVGKTGQCDGGRGFIYFLQSGKAGRIQDIIYDTVYKYVKTQLFDGISSLLRRLIWLFEHRRLTETSHGLRILSLQLCKY